MIMDIFQGWYKDGTEGTYDYRPLSALYMVIRLVLGSTCFVMLVPNEFRSFVFVTGILKVLLGVMFLAIKPYKMKWMSHTDGLFLILLGFFLLTYLLNSRFIYLVGIISGLSFTLTIAMYFVHRCLKKFLRNGVPR